MPATRIPLRRKVTLACNSHFHGHHLFHIKVQLVELNALGEIIRAEVAYSPRIKVVSKFLTKKGSQALPVADVKKFLSMESIRKRRKLERLRGCKGHRPTCGYGQLANHGLEVHGWNHCLDGPGFSRGRSRRVTLVSTAGR